MQPSVYLAAQQLLFACVPCLADTSQPAPDSIYKKPDPISIDKAAFAKSSNWSTVLENSGYTENRNDIAKLFYDWSSENDMADDTFYRVVQFHMNWSRSCKPPESKNSRIVTCTKSTFDSVYGSGLSDLFGALARLGLFKTLGQEVNTIDKSLGFLHGIIFHTAKAEALVDDKDLPFSEISVYLFEEFDDMVKNYMEIEDSSYTNIGNANKKLREALQSISSICQEKFNEINDKDQDFCDEFVKSEFLSKNLPNCLANLEDASNSAFAIIKTSIDSNEELRNNKKYMGHVYMFNHYLNTVRSMVETIVSIKDYNRAGYFGIKYAHTLSKKLSEVAINIFMSAIGKNDAYYDKLQCLCAIPPSDTFPKPALESIDVNAFSKGSVWGDSAYSDDKYMKHRSTIATLIHSWSGNSSVKDNGFYQNIRDDLMCFHRDIPSLHNMPRTKKAFDSTYGSGVSDLFDILIDLKFFDALNRKVNTVDKSIGFLYEVTEYAYKIGFLAHNRYIPISEIEAYLFDEINFVTDNYLNDSKKDDSVEIDSSREYLKKTLKDISDICQKKCDELNDQSLCDEFVKSEFLSKDLPDYLTKLEHAYKNIDQYVLSPLTSRTEVQYNHEECMGHVYMIHHYLNTVRSMVETIVSIKDYNQTGRLRIKYAHTLSKKLSEVAINIFMSAIGKNDAYYDNLDTIYDSKSNYKDWYDFMWYLKMIRDCVISDANSQNKSTNVTEVANTGLRILETYSNGLDELVKDDSMKEIEAVKSLMEKKHIGLQNPEPSDSSTYEESVTTDASSTYEESVTTDASSTYEESVTTNPPVQQRREVTVVHPDDNPITEPHPSRPVIPLPDIPSRELPIVQAEEDMLGSLFDGIDPFIVVFAIALFVIFLCLVIMT